MVTALSDHPLGMHNQIDHSPYGSIGLAVKGIEMYLPLSPTLTLAMFCPSVGQIFHEGADRVRALELNAPHLLAKLKNPEGLKSLSSAMAAGGPMAATPDNVAYCNWIQFHSHLDRGSWQPSAPRDSSVAARLQQRRSVLAPCPYHSPQRRG